MKINHITPYRLEITENRLPKMTNAQNKMHWIQGYKERNEWMHLILFYAMKFGVPITPLKKAKLTFIRYSSKAPDYDGLVSAFKPCIDALVKNYILHDDNMSVTGVPTYQWEKAAPNEGKIKIIVEEIEAA